MNLSAGYKVFNKAHTKVDVSVSVHSCPICDVEFGPEIRTRGRKENAFPWRMLGRRVTLNFMQVIFVNTSPTVIPAVGLWRREVNTCPEYWRPTREYNVEKRD